ncbi:MAG: hypothetical protein ACRDDY_07955 [Clostridium sp.]|uniref:hypothetical protein n=1 Tax=Clostridium sp. TaxID=1506 RepID=UPI003EE5694F
MENNLMINNNGNELMLKFAEFNKNRLAKDKEDMDSLTSIIEELMGMVIKTDGEIGKIGSEVGEINKVLDMTAIDRFDLSKLDELMRKKCFAETGAIGSDRYILFFGKFKANLISSVKKHFGRDGVKMMSIKDLKKSDLQEAILYINRWKATSKLKTKILGEILTEINKLDNEKKTNITQAQVDAYNNYMEDITK